ncbi:HAD family phosphatase [Nocardiopsis sp. HNM0947]|uniref:HAD family phosphatase n=1 Tax=Nocardiopsis coralli TaxID=2772213 RepID=A0ABR9P120_9ACTN|nr:HAD family phosphatase [Nocardiopsis coralli]MBE2997532.1 HAD family phosphatase [Nocardiopsis coralli]
MDTVLFDMFGVIARTQSDESRAALERASGLDPEVFWGSYWGERQAYDRGDVDGPAYWRTVGRGAGTGFDDRAVAELVELDLASWSRVDEEMVSLVTGLSQSGVRLGLLSNIPFEIADLFEAEHARVLDLFPVLGLSCRIGRAKPEAQAFDWCLQGLGVEPGRVLFVDDSERNVAAARELGLGGHHFTSAEGLRKELSERGITAD